MAWASILPSPMVLPWPKISYTILAATRSMADLVRPYAIQILALKPWKGTRHVKALHVGRVLASYNAV
ncbi:uncharacterized protein TRIREDRAFT_111444 [Trichoderma reesei QM6a]|uniref:Predicted protein n=2 Tax=Hypocrea jecorina TaxID=51453 RepID=G0RUM0_HYPJQ|nr:uncharacterized protein TRIREDRAFT_111444 [Trichoderma reesei QM6a]EGR45097.1 predicted protein [Trichoderma reesei QM6a]ETR98269.1 hypothetical protein M419DRAFT_133782 [Trichoderma reesei RUT C-30]